MTDTTTNNNPTDPTVIEAQQQAGAAMAKEVADTYNQKADAQQLSSDMQHAWLKPYAYPESTRAENSGYAWLYMWLWKMFSKGSKLTKSIIIFLVLSVVVIYLLLK